MGAGRGERASRRVSLAELAAHNTAANAWVRIGDRCYDVSRWLEHHPVLRSARALRVLR